MRCRLPMRHVSSSLYPGLVLCLGFLFACGGSDTPGNRDARIGADGPGGQCSFCADSEDCCGGFCVDTQSNTVHCGTCGQSCLLPAADTCSFGACSCAFGPPCTAPEECCPEVGCRDLQSDAANCGVCGMVCGANEICQGGVCVCAGEGAACGAGESCCVDGCTDLLADPQNCDACGNVCEGGNPTCDSGTCGCGDPCPDSPVVGCCADGCYDLCNDVDNCGECGKVCSGCDYGACADDIVPIPIPGCVIAP